VRRILVIMLASLRALGTVASAMRPSGERRPSTRDHGAGDHREPCGQHRAHHRAFTGEITRVAETVPRRLSAFTVNEPPFVIRGDREREGEVSPR
jgi:hypothetical protein